MSIFDRDPDGLQPAERQFVESVSRAVIDDTARDAAERLRLDGLAVMGFSPGDATFYPITVRDSTRWPRSHSRAGGSDGARYTVSVDASFGGSYPWLGCSMDWSYCAQKWTRNGHIWTGMIVAEFLTALSRALAAFDGRQEQTDFDHGFNDFTEED